MKKDRLFNKYNYVQFIVIFITVPFVLLLKITFENKEYCMNLVFVPENDSFFIAELIPQRKYSTIKFTDNQTQTLRIIEQFAYNLQINSIDSLGLKITFDTRIKYQAFINILNTCMRSGISDWLPYGDTIVVFHRDYSGEKPAQNVSKSMLPDMPLIKINYKETYMLEWYQKVDYVNYKRILVSSFLYIIILYFAYKQIKNEC